MYDLRRGDVIFVRSSVKPSGVGLTAVVMNDLPKTVFSGFLIRFRDEGLLDINFKKYCFYEEKFRRKVISASSVSANTNINQESLKQLSIAIPLAKGEQQAIAEVLNDFDSLIESLGILIAKKQLIKQGAMQMLLTGKRRLPGFSGEWEVKKVCQFGEIVTGGTPPTNTKDYWGGYIPWVTPTDISTHKDIIETERQISTLGLSRLRKLPVNSVLVTCIASIGKNVILRRVGASNQQINAIIPNAENDSDFLYYLFEANIDYLKNNAGITATSIISKREFSELTFLVPRRKEQQAIATVLSDMDSEIVALEERLEKTKLMKQGMMQELLTGRIRLI
jgi:type I restriction enzyme S subunit